MRRENFKSLILSNTKGAKEKTQDTCVKFERTLNSLNHIKNY